MTAKKVEEWITHPVAVNEYGMYIQNASLEGSSELNYGTFKYYFAQNDTVHFLPLFVS